MNTADFFKSPFISLFVADELIYDETAVFEETEDGEED